MSQDRSLTGSFFVGIGKIVMVVIGSAALLIVELVAAMLAYMYLAINHRELFGTLVRQARQVLDVFSTQFEALFPENVDAAYATLLGELGPKSILLLLLGLAVGAVVRLIIWLISAFLRATRAVRD
jgi:hypothetical protein